MPGWNNEAARSKILSFEVDPERLTIRTDLGLIALEPRSARTIRIRYTLDAELSAKAKPHADINRGRRASGALPGRGAPRHARPYHGRAVDRDRPPNRRLHLSRRTGGLLAREPARGGKTLERIDVVVGLVDDTTAVAHQDNADGVRIAAVNVRQVVDRHAYHAKLEFEWADG